MNIRIEKKHLRGTRLIDLTEIETEILKNIESKIIENINEIKCFAHSKSVFDIIIQFVDGLPDIHVFVCCPNFGVLLASKLEKEKIYISCSYIKAVGLSSQN